MRGLWLEQGALRYRDDLPTPAAAGEALVRVIRAGVCNTDLELVRGYYPFRGVLGHEFVGVVEEVAEVFAEEVVGDRPENLVGRRVVGEINAVCGHCASCRSDRASHCSHRTVLGIVGRDGAFAEYLRLPVRNLHVVPEAISTDAATFVEPLAAALEIQQQLRVGPEDKVVVVGDGKLGQLIVRTLLLTGCQVTVLGRHRSKLDRLATLGAIVATSSVPERWFDIAVECTGSGVGFELAREALRPRGTLVMKSTYAGSLEINASALVVDEITLIGSRCGPFEPALRLLRDGRVEVEDLVSARFPLERGIEAFAEAQRAGVLKVLLDVEGSSTGDRPSQG